MLLFVEAIAATAVALTVTIVNKIAASTRALLRGSQSKSTDSYRTHTKKRKKNDVERPRKKLLFKKKTW